MRGQPKVITFCDFGEAGRKDVMGRHYSHDMVRKFWKPVNSFFNNEEELLKHD